MQLKRIRDGAEPQAAVQFLVIFLEKIDILMPFGSYFTQFSEPFERIKFLRFESQLKKFFSLLQVKSKTRLKALILGLNFVT